MEQNGGIWKPILKQKGKTYLANQFYSSLKLFFMIKHINIKDIPNRLPRVDRLPLEYFLPPSFYTWKYSQFLLFSCEVHSNKLFIKEGLKGILCLSKTLMNSELVLCFITSVLIILTFNSPNIWLCNKFLKKLTEPSTRRVPLFQDIASRWCALPFNSNFLTNQYFSSKINYIII